MPKGKEINPTFFVFCEGETEERYISYLRSKYRLPVLIDAKIAGNKITEKYIQNYKKNKANHPKDINYLVYDLDVPEILARLISIKDATILSSNPCFELWYLLHFQEQKSSITSKGCEKRLKEHIPNYHKTLFNVEFKSIIEEKQDEAINRATKLQDLENPSSLIYIFINELEKVKNELNNH